MKILSALGGPRPKTATADYTVAVLERMILADASAGALTITLPSAANAWQRIVVKKIDATENAVVVDAAGSQMIDGYASVSIRRQYTSLDLESDGSNWWIV